MHRTAAVAPHFFSIPPMTDFITEQIRASATLTALDTRFGLLRPMLQASLDTSIEKLAESVKKQAFLHVRTPHHAVGERAWLYDKTSGLLWRHANDGIHRIAQDAAQMLKSQPKVGGAHWRLPAPNELRVFAWERSGNPWRRGAGGRLLDEWAWLSNGGRMDLDHNQLSATADAAQNLAGVVDIFANDFPAFIRQAVEQQWGLYIADDSPNLLKAMAGTPTDLRSMFKGIDAHSAKLPALEQSDFTDPNKGLWELWGLDAAELDAMSLRARNPALDVQQGMVAIDFGTSSTVVAYEQNGVGQLLRIGVTDFWEKEAPAHYENPTVLEMVDFTAMLWPWQTQAYRPAVSWDDVRCSHEAQANFRNNQAKPEVVASILTKIKQWALREGDGTRLRLTDQEGRVEHELAPLTLRQPVKGQPLEVSPSDPFDPVELYSWFLGLTINWRRRGIFLRYYLSFPVDYPREVKDKILASFRRGLQRSLPATLVTQPVFAQFTVEERASEPAAYAAVALRTLHIEPTDDGVAYAVFDFGGGTADFDFGYYRWATDEEERAGVEQVLEHFGNGGDKFLGGENLLEHLAYLTFRHNLEVCRSKKIAFSKPLDALDFPGSEMFLERTQAAATNALMLVAKLRPFWETGAEGNSSGVEKIDLIDRAGQKVTCEFTLPYAQLQAFLQHRIEQGVHNFFTSLKKAFGNELPAQVQVLLAGNASRSGLVRGLFGLLPAEHAMTALAERTQSFLSGLFPEGCPEFTAHPPLEADPQDVNKPTAKTGVALGVLELCPGSATRVVNHAARQSSGEAPFQHYVGRIRRRKFHASLLQGASYQQWLELGPVSEDRVFKLFHTQAARALSGDMAPGDPALLLRTLEFAGDPTGHQAYVRPIKPHELEVCTAASLEAAQAGVLENLMVLKLI